MARTFREIWAQETKPQTQLVMWLRPTETGFNLMVFKPEQNKWVSLQSVTKWSDIEGMPDFMRDGDTINEYFKSLVSSAGIADEVAFDYGGTVPAITGLDKTLDRELDGETVRLASVDAALEAIIAKVWFEETTVLINGMGGDVYVGDACGPYKLNYNVVNFHPGAGTSIRLGASAGLTVKPSGAVTETKGEATVSIFTPTSQGPKSVTVTAVTLNSDGKPVTKKATASVTAYFPYYAWASDTLEGDVANRGEKAMLKSETFTFKFIGRSTKYYNLLIPDVAITGITQANTNDWLDKFSRVGTKFNVAGRAYAWYRTDKTQTSAGDDEDVTVTVESIA